MHKIYPKPMETPRKFPNPESFFWLRPWFILFAHHALFDNVTYFGFSDRPWIRTWFSGVITYDHYADLKTISHFYLKLCLSVHLELKWHCMHRNSSFGGLFVMKSD